MLFQCLSGIRCFCYPHILMKSHFCVLFHFLQQGLRRKPSERVRGERAVARQEDAVAVDRTRESPSSDSYTPKASSPRGSRRSTRRGRVRGSCFSLSCEYSFPKSTTFEHNIVECNARTRRRRLKRMLRRRSSTSSKSISFSFPSSVPFPRSRRLSRCGGGDIW